MSRPVRSASAGPSRNPGSQPQQQQQLYYPQVVSSTGGYVAQTSQQHMFQSRQDSTSGYYASFASSSQAGRGGLSPSLAAAAAVYGQVRPQSSSSKWRVRAPQSPSSGGSAFSLGGQGSSDLGANNGGTYVEKHSYGSPGAAGLFSLKQQQQQHQTPQIMSPFMISSSPLHRGSDGGGTSSTMSSASQSPASGKQVWQHQQQSSSRSSGGASDPYGGSASSRGSHGSASDPSTSTSTSGGVHSNIIPYSQPQTTQRQPVVMSTSGSNANVVGGAHTTQRSSSGPYISLLGPASAHFQQQQGASRATPALSPAALQLQMQFQQQPGAARLAWDAPRQAGSGTSGGLPSAVPNVNSSSGRPSSAAPNSGMLSQASNNQVGAVGGSMASGSTSSANASSFSRLTLGGGGGSGDGSQTQGIQLPRMGQPQIQRPQSAGDRNNTVAAAQQAIQLINQQQQQLQQQYALNQQHLMQQQMVQAQALSNMIQRPSTASQAPLNPVSNSSNSGGGGGAVRTQINVPHQQVPLKIVNQAHVAGDDDGDGDGDGDGAVLSERPGASQSRGGVSDPSGNSNHGQFSPVDVRKNRPGSASGARGASNAVPSSGSSNNAINNNIANANVAAAAMANATAAAAAAMAAVDQANLPPEEADAARKAVQRQLQREREWLARQKLKGYVALPEFDGRATTDFYGFGKVLGQGSFGEVRLAWHRLAGQKVAIKSYEKSKMTEPNHWRRVQQEIRLMERLNHPHIIRELEMIDSPKRIHIAMEYAGGGNLCSYVKGKQRLAEPEARKLFLQLLCAVDYMHENCIIHRDIKLENVLFDEEQQNVKLTDFGFSVMVRDPMKRLKIFCGTPSYMAPEITQRREYLGRPVDVWSLAVLLYACLAGHFPFTAKTYPELYKKIAAAQVKFPETLMSSSVKDLLRRMLHPDPMKRLTLAHAKMHPWVSPSLSSITAAISAPADRSLLISDDPAKDVNEAVLQRCEQLGFKRQRVLESILSRTKDACSTNYYLILSRVGRHAQVVSANTGPPGFSSSSGTPTQGLENVVFHSSGPTNASSLQTRMIAVGTAAPVTSGSAPIRPSTAAPTAGRTLPSHMRPGSASNSSSGAFLQTGRANAFETYVQGGQNNRRSGPSSGAEFDDGDGDADVPGGGKEGGGVLSNGGLEDPLAAGGGVAQYGGEEDDDDDADLTANGRDSPTTMQQKAKAAAMRPRSAMPLGRHPNAFTAVPQGAAGYINAGGLATAGGGLQGKSARKTDAGEYKDGGHSRSSSPNNESKQQSHSHLPTVSSPQSRPSSASRRQPLSQQGDQPQQNSSGGATVLQPVHGAVPSSSSNSSQRPRVSDIAGLSGVTLHPQQVQNQGPHDYHHPQQTTQTSAINVSALSAAVKTQVPVVTGSGVTAHTQQALSFLDRIAIQNQQQQRGTNSAPVKTNSALQPVVKTSANR